jgi:Uma2 family endonuclease
VSALTVDHSTAGGHEWEGLVHIWQETDAPEGCKVEIVEGIVTVAPPPSNDHNVITDLVQRRLYEVIPKEWGIYQRLGLTVPETSNLFVPDLCVVPRAALRRGKRVHASEAELVVEVTSRSNANHDRIKKTRGYAKAGVPLYLLLDPWHSGRPTATLYGEPENGTYRVLDSVEYGEEMSLPAPFNLDLDTGIFPVS